MWGSTLLWALHLDQYHYPIDLAYNSTIRLLSLFPTQCIIKVVAAAMQYRHQGPFHTLRRHRLKETMMRFELGRKRRAKAVPTTRNKSRRESRSASKGEEGQGLVEAAVAFLFLLLILLVMYESAMLFTTYIALLNTSVQGAIYAAGHPNMEDDPPDENYQRYESMMQAEALAGGLVWTDLKINPPQLPAHVAPGEPLTVTVDYTMTTFSSEVIFPMFGRLGLPDRYMVSARTAVPIR